MSMLSAISKPEGAGKKEKVSLDSAAKHILEECRMILPGIQALFGFQLIAVFNDGFGRELSYSEKATHLAAIFLVTLSIALVMAPAAIHRQTQQREVSERFIWISSRLVLAGMFPLVGGLCLDIYLVARVILDDRTLATGIAGLLAAMFALLWVLVPRRERGKQEEAAGKPEDSEGRK
jgi:uncharacterized protein DUF6328